MRQATNPASTLTEKKARLVSPMSSSAGSPQGKINTVTSSATIFTKEPTVRIQCQSGSMLITIKDAPANLNGQFSGMVYPKGLAKNSTCLTEYHEQEGPLRYKLPLKSCNTMPIETRWAACQSSATTHAPVRTRRVQVLSDVDFPAG
uniref:ZP domain-containing protein n=1 Tax=Anopheles merus TaxID=30066 RepID=A0A182UT81_ANOME